MMKLIGVGRLGKDAELRYTTNGKPVVNLTLAWNYGKPDEEGIKATQWVDIAFFGPRAEKVQPYLKMGTALFVDVSDVHVETYQKLDGTTGTKLTGTVFEVHFVGSRPRQEEPRKQSTYEQDVPF
jgi:single-strand DNA-binding protein